jgi:hypothetical protein
MGNCSNFYKIARALICATSCSTIYAAEVKMPKMGSQSFQEARDNAG